MIRLTPFSTADFDTFINWINSPQLLVTIAGDVFTYPLTHLQLENYLATDGSHPFNIAAEKNDNIIGHAELLVSGKHQYKIDKLLIGENSNRGKGIGQQVINALLDLAFKNLQAVIVELNVFDWNIAGIKCYEKCGFLINPAKQSSFRVGDNDWLAFNMTINRERYLEKSLQLKS